MRRVLEQACFFEDVTEILQSLVGHHLIHKVNAVREIKTRLELLDLNVIILLT